MNVEDLKQMLADAKKERELAEEELQELQELRGLKETQISPSMVEVEIPQIPSPSQSSFGSNKKRSKKLKRHSRKRSKKLKKHSRKRSKKLKRYSRKRSRK